MVRCEECGFLAQEATRDVSGTERLVEYVWLEAPRDYRRKAKPLYGAEFKCFMDQDQFAEDCEAARGHDGQVDYSGPLSRDRDCGEYMGYLVGHLPKEHLQRREAHKDRRDERCFRFLEVLAFIVAGSVTAVIAALITRG